MNNSVSTLDEFYESLGVRRLSPSGSFRPPLAPVVLRGNGFFRKPFTGICLGGFVRRGWEVDGASTAELVEVSSEILMATLAVYGAYSWSANPIGMTVTFLNCVFPFSEGIPKLDSSIARSRKDLTVVNGKGDGENIFEVADETTSKVGVTGERRRRATSKVFSSLVKDLSREEVTIMLELSMGTTMVVTMSMWARMVPRRTTASLAIFQGVLEARVAAIRVVKENFEAEGFYRGEGV
ncbi:hypothetical protein V6N13_026881 [Hibiscus sabdariffa]